MAVNLAESGANAELALFHVRRLQSLRALDPKEQIDLVLKTLLPEPFQSFYIPPTSKYVGMYVGGNNQRKIVYLDGVNSATQANQLIDGYNDSAQFGGFNPQNKWFLESAQYAFEQMGVNHLAVSEYMDLVGYSAGGGGKFLYCDGCRPSVVRESMDRKNAVRRLNGTLDDEIRRDKNRRISIRRYGIEWEQYEKMLAEQGGVCAICQRPPTGRGTSGQRLHVDHDHSCCPGNRSCGKCVRALLCTNCNRGIGYFQDNPALLRVAINYLTTTNA